MLLAIFKRYTVRPKHWTDCTERDGLVAERILRGVEVTLREVVVDLVNGDTHVLENLLRYLP